MALSVPVRRTLGGVIALTVLALDAASKALVVGQFSDGPAVVVTPFLNIALTFNRGMSYGWFNAGQVPPVAWFALALVFAVFLGAWLWRAPGFLIQIALALIIGGALGNGVDRVTFGAVADFIDVHAAGWHFWTFNIADVGISLGAALLFFDSLLRKPS